MVEGGVFITAIIIAVTGVIKELAPDKVKGVWTVAVAVLVGALVAVLDTQIGVGKLEVAQGILLGLTAAGVVKVADRVGG